MLCGRGGFSEIHRGGRKFGRFGLQCQPGRSSVRNIFEGSFTEEGKRAGDNFFERGFKLEASETRNKLYSTYSAERGAIGD